jgi:3'-phosphoadenosine 5'-phosphosulfate sulfotransferase (PAPS reductase)/FAD synthetase
MVADPFKIDSPTCISFSGGRTSAYMLWRVLQSNRGLPAEAVVCFANTGKEDEATLRFVHLCSREWRVPITWLEYRKDGYEVVNYESASRSGEPFEQLIDKRKYLPNTFARFCTSELKINIIKKHMKSLGFDEFVTFVGIRADEPRRVAKMRNNADEKETPLATVGIGNADVLKFWEQQPFNLDTVTVEGNSLLSNCDLCFLKKPAHLLSLVKDKPERAIWWANMEAKINARFNQAIPSYASISKFAEDQVDMFATDEEGIPCFCGD